MMNDAQRLAFEIASARDPRAECARVTIGTQFVATVAFLRRRNEEIEASADAMARWLGFREPGIDWHRIDTKRARRVLVRVLHQDLAYDSDRMPLHEAERLAEAFLSMFQDPVVLTNGSWGMPVTQTSERVRTGPSWFPITDSTFDGGIVCVGRERVGIVWVQDED